MIAQVIVNNVSRKTDKKFDYIIPEELENKVKIGTRVIVPFGRGDKRLEAYVVNMCVHSTAKKLKQIISAEDMPVFFEKTVELIEWMREKYYCTYIDAIKVIVPAGSSVNSEEWAVLKNESASITKKEKKLVDFIKANGGSCEADRLMLTFEEENVRSLLKQLYEKGVLEKEYKDIKKVKDKTVRIVKLCISCEEAIDLVDSLNKARATAQAKVLEVLSSVDIISSSDLMTIAQCSYNTLTSLKKKGLIEYENVVVQRSHRDLSEIERTKPPILTMEQENACKQIREEMVSGRFSQVLLHGVTGSGKTEVFMNAIQAVVESGRQAIMLVPEIALTPQMMERFIARFGERVAVFHSGLSMGERYDEWKKMRDKRTDIVIGARSAIFAPFDDPGIIIIDEEHESTYKSEMLPRYDTKEVARFRAMQHSCTVVYASATPDIKTYNMACEKKIKLIELKNRVNKNPIPEVTVVDMRKELSEGNKSIFSRRLIEEIKKNLENREQTILFLNRRGFSTFVSCRSCGYVAYCPNCNISMTYHKANELLKCHYCGYTVKNYTECPKCKSKYIRYFGGGTQRVQEETEKLFPNATTLRMDVDTTIKQNSHEEILKSFEKEKVDILIGTQMVAKGLDFPNVTLVGVISADTMLNLDDYRSGERAFDLLEQVSGRAGRASKKGRSIIQTYSPEHMAVVYASRHDYREYYKNEIKIRQSMWYPPFCEMISILFTGMYENIVSQCARAFAHSISAIKGSGERVQILGPVPAALSRIKNKYRWRILIKCENADRLTRYLSQAAEDCEKNKNFERVSIVIDKNPNNIY